MFIITLIPLDVNQDLAIRAIALLAIPPHRGDDSLEFMRQLGVKGFRAAMQQTHAQQHIRHDDRGHER